MHVAALMNAIDVINNPRQQRGWQAGIFKEQGKPLARKVKTGEEAHAMLRGINHKLHDQGNAGAVAAAAGEVQAPSGKSATGPSASPSSSGALSMTRGTVTALVYDSATQRSKSVMFAAPLSPSASKSLRPSLEGQLQRAMRDLEENMEAANKVLATD